MVEFEGVRPLEGMWDPLSVRLEMRRMLERWLSRPHSPSPMSGLDEVVDELGILDLCQHYRVEYPGGAADIARAWDGSELRIADGGPMFDELVRLGWVFFDGGRWIVLSTPPGTFFHVTYPSASTKTFLAGLGKAQLVAKTATPPTDAQTLAAKILAEGWLDERIPTRNTDWLAGRLWERLCPKPQRTKAEDGSASPVTHEADAEAVDRAFLEWSAWCDSLGCVTRWDVSWGPTEMRYCREAAHRVLQRQTLWGTWGDDAERYADVLEKTFAIPPERLRFTEALRKAPPQTLVDRTDWLKGSGVEHLMMERLAASTVGFAFCVLCSELESTNIGPSIAASAATVLSFAANHPVGLLQLIFRVRNAPELLVDMLMHPVFACLAAKLIIEWRPTTGLDGDRKVSREVQARAFAEQDALSLLAYHLSNGALHLEECASLVTWGYASSSGGRRAIADSRRLVGRQLLEVIAREKNDVQAVVLKHLVDQAAFEDNVPRVYFSGVLDALNCLPEAPNADAASIVALYAKFARDFHLEWTDASSLSAEMSSRLVAIAFTLALSERDALLVPFDSAKLLLDASDEERASLRTSVAQTLRQHVRLIARAVIGWSEGALPAELCDALLALISRSTIEHTEKGRVGALTDRYSPIRFFGREEDAPAKDLADAWRRLDKGRQDAMLHSLTQSDDPVLLAELCQHLPAEAKSVIRARLRQLTPGEASALWTWPEVQHRIESLLAAGEYGLAREHFDGIAHDVERAPGEFRLALFGLGLRLLMKEKNWEGIDSAAVPSTMGEHMTRQARSQLDFYQATSQLLRPKGNLAGARAVLQRLAASPGAAAAYKENVFAVAIQQLLGPTLHPLVGADKVAGEELLAEINAVLFPNERLASSDLLANRALLLLALQRPGDALESVASRRQEMRSSALEHVAVLAKAEMGSLSEAMAILDAAILEFDTDDELTALKLDLQSGVVAPSIASASHAIDLIPSIRASLQQLTELPPSLVGDVLGPPGRGVRGYLVRQVSRAVASLQHMAAMLRDRKNPKDDAKFENDLNTAVRELLGARLSVAKWDVADQSLGGTTAKGNPGERDAVVRVDGQEVAIYEALVCSGLDRPYTKEHFDKLLSYGVCDIYFHVTYSYAKKLKPLLDYVRHMLEHEAPSDLTYIGCELLGPPDYETRGYLATYRVEHRELAVAFLIVDLKDLWPQVA